MNLLLAAVLFMQEKSALKILEQIEETIQKAKTVSIKCKGESDLSFIRDGQKVELKSKYTGSLFLADGNKAYVSTVVSMNGKETEYILISDGSKMMHTVKGQPHAEALRANTYDSLNQDMSTTFVRVGQGFVWISLQEAFTSVASGGIPPNMKKAIHLYDVRMGDDDGKAKTLTYFVAHTGAIPTTVQVKLWYDSVSFKLFKSTQSLDRNPEQPSTCTETYDEFTLNADIPDEKFKLPEEKK